MARFNFDFSKVKQRVGGDTDTLRLTGVGRIDKPQGKPLDTPPQTDPKPVAPCTTKNSNLLQQMQAALNQKGAMDKPKLTIPKLPALRTSETRSSWSAPITDEPDWVTQGIYQEVDVPVEQETSFDPSLSDTVKPLESKSVSPTLERLDQTATPPGSHYPEWVWNAMMPVRRRLESVKWSYMPTTVELYVRSEREASASLNLANHCLINLPAPDAQSSLADLPWGIAKRVLLVPVIYRLASRTPDLTAVQGWLNDGFNHLAVLGRCAIETPEHLLMRTGRAGPKPLDTGNGANVGDDVELPEFWVIVPKRDSEAIHKRVIELGELHSYGRALTLDEPPRRISDEFQLLSNRKTPIPPAQRYLGVWRGTHAAGAIDAARRQVGPLPPGIWQKEDLNCLRCEHSTRAEDENLQANVATTPEQPTFTHREKLKIN